MYRHSNQSAGSAGSVGRRISTNNPFRSALLQEGKARERALSGSGATSIEDAQYSNWLDKRIEEEQRDEHRRNSYLSNDDDYYDDNDANSFVEGDEINFVNPPASRSNPPSKPINLRTSSDNSIQRTPGNPFSHPTRSERSNSGNNRQPSMRSYQREQPEKNKKEMFVPPPSYDEVVGKSYSKNQYPKDEKVPYTIEANPFPTEESNNYNTPRRAKTISSRRPAPPLPPSHTKPRLNPDTMTNTTTTRIMSDGRVRSKSTGEPSPRTYDESRRSRPRHSTRGDDNTDSRGQRSQNYHRHSHRRHPDYDRSRERYYDRDYDRDYDKDYDRDYDRPRRSGTRKKFVQERSKNLDTIDKLDVTGFFGGGKFHHDGPFDACTPQRNKDAKAAPVDAFPIDGPNNSIKGMAPGNSKDEQYDMVFGIDKTNDDDNSYPAGSGKARSNSASDLLKRGYTNGTIVKRADSSDLESLAPANKAPGLTQVNAASTDKLHGDTTLGLGSSTFMDGAPAYGARSSGNGGDLQRKKTFLGRMKTIVRK